MLRSIDFLVRLPCSWISSPNCPLRIVESLADLLVSLLYSSKLRARACSRQGGILPVVGLDFRRHVAASSSWFDWSSPTKLGHAAEIFFLPASLSAFASFDVASHYRFRTDITWRNPFWAWVTLVYIKDTWVDKIWKFAREFGFSTLQKVSLSVSLYIIRAKLNKLTIEIKTKTDVFYISGCLPLVNLSRKVWKVDLCRWGGTY